MNELIVESEISSHILILYGKQVTLDRDLAVLYQVVTKRLNEQAKRNIDRFPEALISGNMDALHSLSLSKANK
jgi:hypothetical protein